MSMRAKSRTPDCGTFIGDCVSIDLKDDQIDAFGKIMEMVSDAKE